MHDPTATAPFERAGSGQCNVHQESHAYKSECKRIRRRKPFEGKHDRIFVIAHLQALKGLEIAFVQALKGLEKAFSRWQVFAMQFFSSMTVMAGPC